jgi:hypothetical protein
LRLIFRQLTIVLHIDKSAAELMEEQVNHAIWTNFSLRRIFIAENGMQPSVDAVLAGWSAFRALETFFREQSERCGSHAEYDYNRLLPIQYSFLTARDIRENIQANMRALFPASMFASD